MSNCTYYTTAVAVAVFVHFVFMLTRLITASILSTNLWCNLMVLLHLFVEQLLVDLLGLSLVLNFIIMLKVGIDHNLLFLWVHLYIYVVLVKSCNVCHITSLETAANPWAPKRTMKFVKLKSKGIYFLMRNLFPLIISEIYIIIRKVVWNEQILCFYIVTICVWTFISLLLFLQYQNAST